MGCSGEVEYLLSGGGFEGDLVAEGFELADSRPTCLGLESTEFASARH